VRVVGRLVDLDESAARGLRVGARYPPDGSAAAEIVALGDAVADTREVRLPRGTIELDANGRWQRTAAILMDCELTAPLQCRIGGVPIQDGTLVDVPGSGGTLHLRVEEFVPATPPVPATVRIRFLAPAEAIDVMKPGDKDQSAPDIDERGATIVSVERREVVQGNMTLPATSDVVLPPASLSAADRVAAIDAVVRLGADRASDGLRYRLQPLSVGRSIVFVTPQYTLRGLVRSISEGHAPPAERR
jgi:hypothetical protein